MFRRIAYLLPILATLAIAFAWLAPAESAPNNINIPTPTAPPTLPACTSEDGSGQALCYWDADTQGNGLGQDVISGDCAPEYVGSNAISEMCLSLYGNGQNGIDAARECVETNNTISDSNRAKREWTIANCFKNAN